MNRRIASTGLAVVALATMLAAACGDDDGGSPTTAATTTPTMVGAAQATPTAGPSTPTITATATVQSPATLTAAGRQALLDGINEEYKARATYQAVIDKLGQVAPFTNILQSENSHVAAWVGLLSKYGVPVPADPFMGTVTVPATLREACAVGVEAETADVALYDRLLASVKEADIVSVMTQQRAVSNDNHRPAFERCA